MRSVIFALLAIVAGAFLLQAANGWLGLLVPAELGRVGYPATVVGIVVTAHSVGFFVGCFVSPRLIRRIGHIRAFSALAAAAAVGALAFSLATEPVLWTALRLLTGFCSAGLFNIAEAWIAAQTPSEFRGRVLSLYMISNKLAVAGGQLLLAGGGIDTTFFLFASAFYSLSLIPVATTSAATPNPPRLLTLGVRRLFRIAPAGVVGCFGAGLINTAMTGVLPLYAVASGLGIGRVAVLLALMQAGSLFMQWPLGWMSDRIDRRTIIAGSALAVAVISALLAVLASASIWLLYFLSLLWGGFALSIYALCLAHAGDFAEPQDMVPLSSSLLLTWATGSIAGPALATVAMQVFGPSGLFWYCGVASLILAAFVGWRMTRRRARPPEERDPFVGPLAATTPAATALDPRNPHQDAHAPEGRERAAAGA